MASQDARPSHEAKSDDKKKSRVILKMSVQLPDGTKGIIHVFPGSDAHVLAEAFCQKHDLHEPKLLKVVERHILTNMAALKSGGGKAPSSKPPPPTTEPPPPIASGRPVGGRPPPPSNPREVTEPPRSAPGAHARASSSTDRASPAPKPPPSNGHSGSSKQPVAAAGDAAETPALQAEVQRLEAQLRARDAEINELHAQNSRIAMLAFAQAGRSPAEAAKELDKVLEPKGGAAERLREQLERVLDREMERRERETRAALMRTAWHSWMGARPDKPGRSSAKPSAKPSATAVAPHATAGESEGGGASLEQSDSEAAALAAAEARASGLAKEVAELQAEVAHLTQELISAKLGRAELEENRLTVTHSYKQLERQLVIESVDMVEVPYLDPPSKVAGRAVRTQKSFGR